MGVLRRHCSSGLIAATVVVYALLAPLMLCSEERESEPKARFSESASGSLASIQFAPVTLQGGSRLTVISPLSHASLSAELTNELKRTHMEFSRLLGDIPPFKSAVRLMDEGSFFSVTKAPPWTNALFYRGEIIIPLEDSEAQDVENMKRSLRHEYMHAVINVLSDGRCPGWLDEGLAQWAEGSENPALQPALTSWLKNNKPISLDQMQGGFTRFEQAKVPVAYAQSLFAANSVINTYGFQGIRRFMDSLRSGRPQQQAFRTGFGLGAEDLEKQLHSAMFKWKRGG